jgi:hypothetical protein
MEYRRNQPMPKKEVWLSEETLNDIRKILGIKPGEQDKGVSEYIRKAVEERNNKVLEKQ